MRIAERAGPRWWLVAGLAVAVLAAALPAGGCTGAARERFEEFQRNTKRAAGERQLRERAEEFWDSVRWRDWASASRYLESAESQRQYLQERSSDVSAAIDEVSVQYVFVSPEHTEAGEVRVAWKTVAATAGRVDAATSTQQWYKHRGFWWLSPESVLADPLPAEAQR
jgi:hypothetical protein